MDAKNKADQEVSSNEEDENNSDDSSSENDDDNEENISFRIFCNIFCRIKTSKKVF